MVNLGFWVDFVLKTAKMKLPLHDLLIVKATAPYKKRSAKDAHCGVQCRCRKRPPQAQECARHILCSRNNKDVNSNKEKVDNRKRHGYTIFICCK